MKDALDALLDRYAPGGGGRVAGSRDAGHRAGASLLLKIPAADGAADPAAGTLPAVTAALRCARRAAAYALVLPSLCPSPV